MAHHRYPLLIPVHDMIRQLELPSLVVSSASQQTLIFASYPTNEQRMRMLHKGWIFATVFDNDEPALFKNRKS
jgi:hypothetical protein